MSSIKEIVDKVRLTRTKAKELLTQGNHKLSTNIYSWSLPASEGVCGRICDGCYAIKAQRIYPAVLPSRENKLSLSRGSDFVDKLVEAVEVLQPKFVRIHDSGEFYSQEYVNKWVEIVKRSPKSVVFFAYTKRLSEYDFSRLKAYKNVVVIDSLHNGKLNFGKLDKRPLTMFLCPDHKESPIRLTKPKGPICGIDCSYCMTKDAENTGVYFVKH